MSIPDFSNPNSSLNNHKLIISEEEAKTHFESIKTRDLENAERLEEAVKQAIKEKKSASDIIGMVIGFGKGLLF